MWARWASALVVLLIAGCSTNAGATPAVAVNSVLASARPVATVSPSLAPVGWAQTYGSDLAELHDVVAGPHGLAAVGCAADLSGNCLEGLLLTSPDGSTWTKVDLAGAADTRIWRVRQAGGRLFAIGDQVEDAKAEVRAAVWVSHDGSSWQAIDSPSFTDRSVEDVIASPAGTLAVGIHAPYSSEGYGVVVWDISAQDAFGLPRDVRATDGPATLAGAVWTGDRYLAWGPCGPCPSGDHVTSTVLAVSADGRTWRALPTIAAFHGSSVGQILATASGLVAVGRRGTASPTEPRAWTSSDGATWQAAAVPTGQGALGTVGLEAGLLVARGNEPVGDERRSLTWISVDGASWTRLPAGVDMPDLTGYDAASRATVGARACVAGTFYGRENQLEPRAAIYCR